MTAIHDPNFGASPHMMPNYAFTCPDCTREILIYKPLPILPPSSGETTFDLKCPHPQCGWIGTLRDSDARPYPPPEKENV
jgi:hypothetical protein